MKNEAKLRVLRSPSIQLLIQKNKLERIFNSEKKLIDRSPSIQLMKIQKIIGSDRKNDTIIGVALFELVQKYVISKFDLKYINEQCVISEIDFYTYLEEFKTEFDFLQFDETALNTVAERDILDFLCLVFFLCNEYKYKKSFDSHVDKLNETSDKYEDLIILPYTSFKNKLAEFAQSISFEYDNILLFLDPDKQILFIHKLKSLIETIIISANEQSQFSKNNNDYILSYEFDLNEISKESLFKKIKFKYYDLGLVNSVIYIIPKILYNSFDTLKNENQIGFEYKPSIFIGMLKSHYVALYEILFGLVGHINSGEGAHYSIPYDSDMLNYLNKVTFYNYDVRLMGNEIIFFIK